MYLKYYTDNIKIYKIYKYCKECSVKVICDNIEKE